MAVMESLVAWVAQTIEIFGYPGIIFLMMLESIILPLPSEIILPLAGFLVGQGMLNLWFVALAATLGSVLGSCVSYEIGRSGGRPFLVKYGRFFLMRPDRLRKTERWFRDHGEGTILVSRMLPLTRYFISIPAGFARMPRRTFILYTAIGSFIWNITLIYGGVLLGQYWYTIIEYGAQVEVVIGSIVILFAMWYVYQASARRSAFLKRLTEHKAVRENVRLVRRNIRRAQKFGKENIDRFAAAVSPERLRTVQKPLVEPAVVRRKKRR